MPATTTATASRTSRVDYWDDRIQVNLRHQFFAAQAVRPQMRDSGGGSIVNLGSVSWMIGEADCIAYVTAKVGRQRPDARPRPRARAGRTSGSIASCPAG